MEQTNTDNTINRDYNTISPSAISLQFLKGHTNIPFARETAELLALPEKYAPGFNKKDMTFWARVLHFEYRYWSIDNLLEDISVKNILELSSGFSFRGLETAKQKGYHYIDTDLPDVITSKNKFIAALTKDNVDLKGTLELLPLNALDEKQFHDVVSRFTEGEIAIVNEGLLMYLDTSEKEKLCKIIHKMLSKRGGYWITADIYFKNKAEKLELKLENKTREFFEQHRIENNKFENSAEAEEFFKRMGFVVDKEADINRRELSSMKYFLKNTTPEELAKIRSAGKVQATWRLKVA
jgi:O-methyltransferase involved in polyketide biosynthesis